MSVRSILPAAGLLLAACTSNAQAPAAPASLPEGTPKAEFVAHCEGKDGWSDPAPPVRIFGNVYQVGTCGIVSLMIVSDQGLIVIDGASNDGAPLIAANIEKLGYKLSDVKWLLNTHEHYDHAGGLAGLKQLTGAQVAARAAQKAVLETGVPTEADPQHELDGTFTGVPVDRLLADGEVLTLGNVSLTAVPAFGHAPGSTTWTLRACEREGGGETCHDVVFGDSLSAVSGDTYRFSDHPEYVAEFRRTLDRMAGLKCDLLITPHPSASGLYDRLAGKAPLTDPQACRNYAETARTNLDARLAREARP